MRSKDRVSFVDRNDYSLSEYIYKWCSCSTGLFAAQCVVDIVRVTVCLQHVTPRLCGSDVSLNGMSGTQARGAGTNKTPKYILTSCLCWNVAVVVTAVLCKQRATAKENTAKITAKLTGMDGDQEPLTPTNAVPDMSKLRLIKVSQVYEL